VCNPLAKLAAVALAHADPEVAALGQRIADWVNGRLPGPMEAALGIAPGPGQRSLPTKAALARRDELYRALAAAHFPRDTRRGRAASVHLALSDYAGRAWPREKERACRHPPGSLPFFMWSIMAAHEAASTVRPARPLAVPQIEKLLRDGSPSAA
jgi:hypothetical protein